MVEPIAFDASAAVAFAARFGPPNIMAFDGGRCLPPDLPTTASARDFIAATPNADLYFAPAALRDAFVGKPRKGDCVGSEWAWADIDPPKGMATDTETLAAWRSAALAEIDATDCPARADRRFVRARVVVVLAIDPAAPVCGGRGD